MERVCLVLHVQLAKLLTLSSNENAKGSLLICDLDTESQTAFYSREQECVCHGVCSDLEGEFTLGECDINKLARFDEHKV